MRSRTHITESVREYAANTREYAGYVQRAAPIDWSMVAEDIITKLGNVEKDKADLLAKEYEIAINNFNLNENEIRTIIINGFKSAFQSHNERRELIQKVVDELARNRI